MAKTAEGQLNKKYWNDFSGGVNSFLGPRQIKDNESPNAINCDFYGKGGVGNRQGYSQLGATGATYDEGIFGMSEYHTSALDQLIKFASDGSNVVLNYSSNAGTTWTAVTGTKFTDDTDIDVVQATLALTLPTPNVPVSTDGYLFSFNGVDQMVKYDGAAWAAHTGATKGYYGAFFDNRLWCVDDEYRDVLNYSSKSPGDHPLDFVTANSTVNVSAPGTIQIRPGSGAEITGMVNFKNNLYVFLKNAIFRIATTADVNVFNIELVTNAVGCVSHRSISQVGEDIFFASEDGIYSLGDVANYTEVRTTNKSARVQEFFNNLSAANKAKLVGVYHNFKYHLFYSFNGSTNDSCLVYDVRYGGWHDWRNIAANDATLFTNSSGTTSLFFGHPTTGAVYKLYDGSTDDGTAITSTWYSKSFDFEKMDVTKLFFDSTFLLNSMAGVMNFSVIFNDTEVTVSKTLDYTRPTGGMGRTALGRISMTPADITTAGGGMGFISDMEGQDVSYVGVPLRFRAKGQKFAIQYRISTTGQWQLDSISQTFIEFSHYKFPSYLKIN